MPGQADTRVIANQSAKVMGDLEVIGHFIHSYQAVTVAGTTQTQAGATKLRDSINIISACANTLDGVALPIAGYADASGMITVVNNGVTSAQVWPDVLGTIDDIKIGASVTDTQNSLVSAFDDSGVPGTDYFA